MKTEIKKLIIIDFPYRLASSNAQASYESFITRAHYQLNDTAH